jgi:hypothetical protein
MRKKLTGPRRDRGRSLGMHWLCRAFASASLQPTIGHRASLQDRWAMIVGGGRMQ